MTSQARSEGRALVRETAPAKVNLILHVGPRRADGLHELCSLFASLMLADELTVEPAAGPSDADDEVICPGVQGPNLVAAALAAFRSAAGAGGLPPLKVTIDKRIPVAGGLGGGSADAAAALRAANKLARRPLDPSALHAIARELGADVPSQLEPRHALVTGAGEYVEPIDLPDMTLVLAPAEQGLSTKDVYAEADRLPSTRAQLEPDSLRRLADAPLAALSRRMENDLEAAALSLRPELATILAQLRDAGALATLVSGSGPTVVGVFEAAAEAAAAVAVAILHDAIVTPLRQP
jgi:4-diphosphocytidyl-2-C-methyl-D-erythritol kinase